MRRMRASLCVLTATFLFGIMPIIIKNTYDYGANSFNLVFYMALISIPVYCVILKMTGVRIRPTKKLIVQCAVAGLSDIGTFLFLYLSYHYIKVGIATMLNFIYPIMVALVLYLFFEEQFPGNIIFFLAIYMTGMVLMCGGELEGNFLGYLLAILSGLSYTVQIIYMDKSGLSSQNIFLVGLYKSCTVALTVLLLGWIGGVSFRITGIKTWSAIIVVSIFCRIISSALIMIGVRELGAFLPSVLSTFEPVVSLLMGWLVLQERITGLQILGIVMILYAIFQINSVQQKKETDLE